MNVQKFLNIVQIFLMICSNFRYHINRNRNRCLRRLNRNRVDTYSPFGPVSISLATAEKGVDMKEARVELNEIIEVYRENVCSWRDVSDKLDIEDKTDEFILDMAMRGIDSELNIELDEWFDKYNVRTD